MHKDVDGRGKSVHMTTRSMAGLDNELSKWHVDSVLKHFGVPSEICVANKEASYK